MDVATLAIKVENGQVTQAVTSLDKLEVAGTKAEIATSRLSRRMALAEIEARKMDAAMKAQGHTAQMLTGALSALSVIAVAGFIGRKTIDETIEAQNAMAQLEAAVASTGGVAGRTVQQLDDLSMSLQRQTTFSDEAVKGAEAMLLTFDKIRGTEFDRATAAVTDLATRLGGDLQGAAIQVGKALQDPTTGLTALRRSGVSFSESQIALIKSLYDSGQAAEGQRVILKELEHQFGGSAAAARDTLGGALAGLKNAWGDLFEVTKGGSQGTVDALNGITHAMESSNLSMNSFLTEWTSEWALLKAGIAEVWAILSTPITGDWAANVRKQIDAIEFDLSTKLAAIHAPAKVGAGTGHPAAAGTDETAAAKHEREANADMVREAQQAVDLAGLEGRAQEIAKISYEETNKAIKAQRELKGDLLDETLAAIHAEADYRRQAATVGADTKLAKDLQEIWQKGVSDVVRATQEGIAAMLSSVASLFHDMLTRLQKDGKTNTRMELGLVAISGGLAGYETGQSMYSSSHGAVNNYSRGALGGAGSGALAGASLGSIVPGIGTAVGAIVGGAAGFIGGVLGMASAAKAAARQMAEAQKQVELSMASLRAAVAGDALAQGIAQINADREERRKAIEDAYQGGGADSEQVRRRQAVLAEMNALEDQRIAQLQQEAMIIRQRFAEDLQVRLLTAEGQSSEAEALRLQLAQQREYQDAVKAGADPATLALLQQVQAQEKLAAATNKATSSALNMVEGYKIQAAIFGAMSGRPSISGASGPVIGMGASRAPSAGGDLTVNVMTPSGDVLGKLVLRDFRSRKDRGDAELGSVLS